MGIESIRKLLAISINLLIALLHIIGPLRQESGTWHDLYYSYFSDLTLPFGYYFLLGLAESNIQFLKSWWVKAGLLFLGTLSAELLQLAGVYALGTVFDPVDIVMYASGISLAVLLERILFPGFFLSQEK
jgi:hypothetical protein